MNHSNVKAILSLVILFVAFSILLIFKSNQDVLMQPAVFPMFMVLAAIGLGLLAGLLFLVGSSVPSAAKQSASKKVASKSKKKKK